MSALKGLVGQQLERVEAVHDYYQLHFSAYLLNVFNPMVIKPGGPLGMQRFVTEVRETEKEIDISLSDGSAIVINLSPEAWTGPEALALYRGADSIMVWT